MKGEKQEKYMIFFTIMIDIQLITILLAFLFSFYSWFFILYSMLAWFILFVLFACIVEILEYRNHNEQEKNIDNIWNSFTSVPTKEKNTCERCGLAIEMDVGFCGYCGNRVEPMNPSRPENLELINVNDVKIEPDANIGDKGTCERCGAEGKYMYDPYDEDIYGEKNLKCYCKDCTKEIAWEI